MLGCGVPDSATVAVAVEMVWVGGWGLFCGGARSTPTAMVRSLALIPVVTSLG